MKYLQLAGFLLLFLLAASCRQKHASPKGELIIFHAGSLSVPLKQVSEAFNKEFPGVKIEMESAGSVASARKITDLSKPCDILVSADYAVIDNMLIPRYADWNIRFASNELCLVFTDRSRYAGELDSLNWTEMLMKQDVVYGRSDPNSDPCGYRTVLCAKLAEKYYNKPGFSDKLLAKNQNIIRPKEVDLLALLETGAADYIFIYKSVAIQHKLKYLSLPGQVNLGDPGLSALYNTVSTEINGPEPGTKETVKGEPMVYGVTVLKDAPNREAALSYLSFLLDAGKGMKIMSENGQPSVIPSVATHYDKIPGALKPFAKL